MMERVPQDLNTSANHLSNRTGLYERKKKQKEIKKMEKTHKAQGDLNRSEHAGLE